MKTWEALKAADVFVPFLGDLFFNYRVLKPIGAGRLKVFVPFPGDFFSIYAHVRRDAYGRIVFVPFPGDFFSMNCSKTHCHGFGLVFVPFLGDFFSIVPDEFFKKLTGGTSFRPLSWGLFFNNEIMEAIKELASFRPLSWGLFFNRRMTNSCSSFFSVFVPFLGDFFSMNGSCPVCTCHC